MYSQKFVILKPIYMSYLFWRWNIMDLYTSYTEADIENAAEKKLQVVNDYKASINAHLANIKKRILIDDNTLLSIVSAINAGFNVILYGPPGTAKSTISEFLPVEFYGAKCNVHTADSEWNVRKVIGGISVTYDLSSGHPQESIGPKDGYIVDDIMECYESRLETTEFDTVFTIIDEFNRTNMDECLGPMFTAMGSDNKILKLDYNKGFNESFLQVKVPSGYRMICNMNKYDRTFTNELSDALARRFKWIYIGSPTEEFYDDEEQLVKGNVFGSVASIKPTNPVNLIDVEDCVPMPLFDNLIIPKIFEIINDLRSDLEVGTSYKIDAIKLANHFFALKMETIDWDEYTGVDCSSTCAKIDIASAIVSVADPAKKVELKSILENIIIDTVDAALVMTIIPACESLEDSDAIDRNKVRFENYTRCASELERMKILF